MSMILHPLFVVLHLVLVVWGFTLWRRDRSIGVMIVVITASALAYDNLILALGSGIGVGDTLETLSVPRYIFHAIVTPLLIVTALDLTARSGVVAVQNRLSQMIVGGVAVVLIGLGMFQGVVGMHLKPACHDGVLRYAERLTENQLCENVTYADEDLVRSGMPPLASISTVFVIGGFGIVMGRNAGIWWMLVGAVVMFITAAVPASRVGLWVGNGGEIILLASLLYVASIIQRREGFRGNQQGAAVSAV